MICKECKSENKKSTITPNGGSVTCMGFSPYWDEDGEYHYHNPNRYSEWYSCSNGHVWGTSTLTKGYGDYFVENVILASECLKTNQSY